MREILRITTRPSDVKADDISAVKLVAVAGYDNDWACYSGPTTWCNEHVAREGDKVSEEEAGVFSYLMQLRRYRQ